MIRQGKSSPSAWLSLAPASLSAWATLNAISFNHVGISTPDAPAQQGSPDAAVVFMSDIKGSGLVAIDDDASGAVVTLPKDMVLSEARVRQLASGDARLADILSACGPLAMVRLSHSGRDAV